MLKHSNIFLQCILVNWWCSYRENFSDSDIWYFLLGYNWIHVLTNIIISLEIYSWISFQSLLWKLLSKKRFHKNLIKCSTIPQNFSTPIKAKIEHTSSVEMAQTPGQSSRQFVHSISLLLSRSFKRGTGSQFCELIQIWNFSTWRLQWMSGWLVDGGGELRQPHFFPRVSTASSMTGNATIGHNYRSTGSYKSWHRKKSAIHPPTLTPQKWDAAKRNWRWQM